MMMMMMMRMMWMQIVVKFKDMPDFKEMVKHHEVQHGPFFKGRDTYTIDIIKPGSAISYFILKYGVAT